MAKVLVSGKYIDLDEGKLSIVPVKGSRAHYAKITRRSCTRRPNKIRHELSPGYSAWRSRWRSEEMKYMPPGSYGRPLGLPDGVKKGEMKDKDKMIADLFGDDEADLIEIAATIKAETNALVRLTFRRWVRMILVGSSDRDIQRALSEMAAYNKSKPVAKQEVKISDVEEAWSEEIDADALLFGKANCSKSN